MSQRQGLALSLAIVTGWSTLVGLAMGPWWGVAAWVAVWLAVGTLLALWPHAGLAIANARLRRVKADTARLQAENRYHLERIRQTFASVGIDTDDMTDEQLQEAVNVTADALAETGITAADAAVGMTAVVQAVSARQGGRL